MNSTTLSRMSTSKLFSLARTSRDEHFDRTITYSPKAFFPLTMLCRDRCGYCTFAKAPARLDTPYMSIAQVDDLARRAASFPLVEALFTLGERPELRYARAREALAELKCDSTHTHLARAAQTALSYGLLPHINAGTMNAQEITELRKVSVSMGLMLESIVPGLDSHRGAPDKVPERRLETLRIAGTLHVPMTTGLLVGIGDSEQDRIRALEEIARLHEVGGHISEVIIQNFLPKPGTRMAHVPPPSPEVFLRTVALARLVLPGTIHLQAPPNLSDSVKDLIDAGVDDLGGISPLTLDHVNPERPWPDITQLARTLASMGFDLVPRLPLYPDKVADLETWVDPALHGAVRAQSDRNGYAREVVWFSGKASCLNPRLFTPTYRRGEEPSWIADIDHEIERGNSVPGELLALALDARGSAARAVVDRADTLRRQVNGDTTTFVANRNINYTNICTFRCRFCAFSKGPRSLNLRGTPYLLDHDQILAKVAQADEYGATEVCLQGGIHPNFDGRTYIEIAEAIHEKFPKMHIHGFSALEVFTGAKRLGISLEDYLTELKDRGLKSLPGTAAEILSDDVRAIICPDKLSTQEWLEVHETAHAVGLRSNVTIMFGSVETTTQTVTHLLRTRELAEKTGGFTEFVPLPFVHMATPLYLSGKARRGPTLREAVLMHSVGRIAYHGAIDHIQASWVKMGTEGAQLLLRAGTDDLGGTLMEESISHAAGANHASALDLDDFRAIVKPLNRPLSQRTTFYDRIPFTVRKSLNPRHLAIS